MFPIRKLFSTLKSRCREHRGVALVRVGERLAFPKIVFGVDAADRKWHSLACTSDVSTRSHHTRLMETISFTIFDATTSLANNPSYALRSRSQ
jgi:hypothetical protein